jgi:hypothetical protein
VHYLQTIEYDLNDDKQKGLSLFFDMLYETGELRQRVPLNFLPQSPARSDEQAEES